MAPTSVARFGKMSPLLQKIISIGQHWRDYLVFGEILNLFGKLHMLGIGHILIVANDHILKHNLSIWSHWRLLTRFRGCQCNIFNKLSKASCECVPSIQPNSSGYCKFWIHFPLSASVWYIWILNYAKKLRLQGSLNGNTKYFLKQLRKYFKDFYFSQQSKTLASLHSFDSFSCYSHLTKVLKLFCRQAPKIILQHFIISTIIKCSEKVILGKNILHLKLALFFVFPQSHNTNNTIFATKCRIQICNYQALDYESHPLS